MAYFTIFQHDDKTCAAKGGEEVFDVVPGENAEDIPNGFIREFRDFGKYIACARNPVPMGMGIGGFP